MEFARTGTGPTLLLLPGLGCDDGLWRPVAKRLSPRFSIVQPHTWGGGPLSDRARALEALVAGLGAGPVGIAGLSLGGYITLECLRCWPQGIRAVALLDTSAEPDTAERIQTRLQVLRLLEAGRYLEVLGAFVASVLAPGSAAHHPARQSLWAMAQALGPQLFAADVRAILQRGSYTDVLPKIRVPTLFVVGAEDTLTPPALAYRMAAEVPGSRVVEIPAAGHMTPLEDPAATADTLEAFFTAAFHL